jgi:translation initiation factor IF-1
MPKEESIQCTGKVVEILPGGSFKVELDQQNQHQIRAYSAGKIKKNRIRVLKGDKVTVEMTLYDLNSGRIVQIHRNRLPAPTKSSPHKRGMHQNK